MFQTNRKKFDLDPRTKISILILTNISIFVSRNIIDEILLISLISILYILFGLYKSCFKFIFGFSIILFVVYVLSLCVPKILFVPVYIIANFSKKIYSCVMVGTLIIKTTTVRMLIISLEKWKVPSNVTIPLAIAIRYFPALKEEYRHIKESIKLRNITGIKKKIQSYCFPIFILAVHTGDELSAAAITRGIENPSPKSCIEELKFSFRDYLSLGIGTGLIVCMFVVINGGLI